MVLLCIPGANEKGKTLRLISVGALKNLFLNAAKKKEGNTHEEGKISIQNIWKRTVPFP